MNERDRLVELIERHCLARIDVLECTSEKDIECSGCLADHLIANNATIPPVSVGQTVYLIRKPTGRPAWVDECKVVYVTVDYLRDRKAVTFGGHNFAASEQNIGKSLFFTRKEAERALEQGSESE